MEGVTTGNSSEKGIPHELERETSKMLTQRGIESYEEWHEHINTMERDGEMPSTGQIYADRSRQHSTSMALTTSALEDAGSSISQQLVTYLRSMACSDPGVFRGTKSESFEEFLRMFKRKYEQVIKCGATLIEVLGDDHLAGRAKSIFAALPRTTK
ncbi:unnamed protein product [Haemonchus placei]|uniref:Retrotrans_gag domain-containing protein n=1 Tax=Haemonchus placei TaxID=6290 RepID=A0A0N4WD09_HAEPC|nr:unnamed protein product [Haemonchus placei]